MRRIILLHGAIGWADQLSKLKAELHSYYSEVHVFEFSGHGKVKFSGDEFSIPLFVNELMKWIDDNHLRGVEVFGYSMGGYVALYLAAGHPQYFTRIITLGTKFQWTPEIAAKEIRMLDADVIAAKVPAFAKELEERHTAIGWKKNLELTAQMMVSLGNENILTGREFSEIRIPVKILLGDGDKMVSREESGKAASSIANACFQVLDNTPHPIGKVNCTELCKAIIS